MQCNSNSQYLIDSNLQSSPSDRDGDTFPPTTITLISDSGPLDTVVNVFGTGFDENGAVITITFDGNVVAETTTENNGNFSADFKVFAPILGPHTVTAKALLSTTSATLYSDLRTAYYSNYPKFWTCRHFSKCYRT